MKLTLFYLLGKLFRSPPLKFLSSCEIGSCVLDSWYYVEKYQRKRVACYCYQKLGQTSFFKKKFGKCSQIGCFKGRNSTLKTLSLGNHAQMTCFKRTTSRGKLRGMRKLFDCIKTPLKRFLTSLTLHRKEMQPRHLHKKTNPGSTLGHAKFIKYKV